MEDFSYKLISWYQKHKRILPWRIDKDPYHVWISEIMLQQTRIEAVKGYYERFLKRLPTIHDLANIEEDELLKLWQGLGYYNRARNLKKAAIEIEEKYDGKFPTNYEEILSLPGIGEYTAGAIGSICFSLKVPAIDGNVLRVISRLFHIEENIEEKSVKKKITDIVLSFMKDDSGDFNEGLMELGETICLPNTKPLCEKCPLKDFCISFKENDMERLPIRILNKSKKEEFYTVTVLIHDQKIAISKRGEGLLKNMYEFPNIKGEYTLDTLPINENYVFEKEFHFYKHIFTHVIWNMKVYLFHSLIESSDYVWVTLDELKKHYAIPTAFKQVLIDLEAYIDECK